jgi:hypothetical protein
VVQNRDNKIAVVVLSRSLDRGRVVAELTGPADEPVGIGDGPGGFSVGEVSKRPWPAKERRT